MQSRLTGPFARRVTLAFALIGGALACNQPNCDCLVPAAATVFGRVSADSVTPVSGATILGYVSLYSSCDPSPQPSGLTQSSGSGIYHLSLAQGAPSESACVFVRVRGPQGSGLRDTVAGPVRVSFRYASPLDSVALDITLKP